MEFDWLVDTKPVNRLHLSGLN
eukprot:COSAG02_NODE_50378_length_321_cov_0.360360_2_plen_22_part_01